MKIGETIKSQRRQCGLTQKKLSELTGIAEITLRQYEAGKYEPKIDNLAKIAKALDYPLSSFLPPGQKISSYDPEDNMVDTIIKKEDGTLERRIQAGVSMDSNHLTQSEQALLHYFNMLNVIGQNEIIRQAERFTRLAEFSTLPNLTEPPNRY